MISVKNLTKRAIFTLGVLALMLGAFIGGVGTHHQVRRYVERRSTLPDQAGRLLECAVAVREGRVDQGQRGIDECFASVLYTTAYDVDDDKMGELPEELLWRWQQAKEYYEQYDVGAYEPGAGMRGLVAQKLKHVPWSKFQVAKREFDAKYGKGTLEKAPEFSISHWFGESVDEEDMRGKVILLDFWNIHCGPCVKSLPELQEMHDRYGEDGLVVLACTMWLKEETAAFLRRHNYTFPAGLCSEQTWLNFAVQANPTYFVVDREGRLAWGPEHRLPTNEEIQSFLRAGGQ